MQLKEGVSLVGLHESMRPVLMVVDSVWECYGQEAVITAGTESRETPKTKETYNLIHSAGSLHPFGKALDFRTRYFMEEDKQRVHRDLVRALGITYTVILHKTHIHVEYDLNKEFINRFI